MRTRTPAAILLLPAALVLAACGGGSPSTATSPAAGHVTSAATSWTYPLKVGGPTYLYGTTLVTEVDHRGSGGDATGPTVGLACVDSATGGNRWTAELPLPASATLHANGPQDVTLSTGSSGSHAVFLAGYDVDVPSSGLTQGGTRPYVTAFDPQTGKVLWTKQAPGELVAAEAGTTTSTTLRTAVFAAASGDYHFDQTLTALDVSTGSQDWQYTGPAKDVLETGGVVVVHPGSQTNDLVLGLDAATGQQKWTTGDQQRNGLNGWLHYTVLDARAGAVLAVADTGGGSGDTYKAVLLDVATGHPGPSGPADPASTGMISSDGKTGYVLTINSSLVALNAVRGWSISLPTGAPGDPQRLLSATPQQVRLYSAGVVTLDAATGRQLGGVATGGSSDPLVLVGGWSVVKTDGTLTGKHA